MPDWLIGAVSKTVVSLSRYRGFGQTPARLGESHPLRGCTFRRGKLHWLYVLRSTKDGRLYTGVTSDLRRRLREHNSGNTRSTRARRQLVLVYSERFETRGEALARERFLKTPEGGRLKQGLAGQKRVLR